MYFSFAVLAQDAFRHSSPSAASKGSSSKLVPFPVTAAALFHLIGFDSEHLPGSLVRHYNTVFSELQLYFHMLNVSLFYRTQTVLSCHSERERGCRRPFFPKLLLTYVVRRT